LSSAPYFRAFTEFPGRAPCESASFHLARPGPRLPSPHCPIVDPESWLLRQGWRRFGPISVHEHPKS
jgi:hypothetical protein